MEELAKTKSTVSRALVRLVLAVRAAKSISMTAYRNRVETMAFATIT